MFSVAAAGVCPICCWGFSVSVLWAVCQVCVFVLGRGTPQLCFCSVVSSNVLPNSGSKGEKETRVIVVIVSIQALGHGCITLLTVQIAAVWWQLFDLCRVRSWSSLSCQSGTWCIPESASQQLHWPGVKKRSSSSDCTAIFLVPFKLLIFF